MDWGNLRGVPAGTWPSWLPPKFPGDTRECRFEISQLDWKIGTALSLAAAPSGAGELTLGSLAFGNGVVTFSTAGGQPGRTYTLMLAVTRSDGAVTNYQLMQRVNPVLSTDTAQAVPSYGFGTALTLSI